ncbi:MAG: hypothetical protein E7186_05390 [Erysipelotrichaceae bacterium]|nr:hypothetical protein [Erysipelotrichaceae bacterium]
MNNSLKTVMLILTGTMMLLSIIVMMRFRSLRLKAIESSEEKAALRKQMIFLIIMMSLVMIMMLTMSRFILIRYFNG